jgi:hypothetical protein
VIAEMDVLSVLNSIKRTALAASSVFIREPTFAQRKPIDGSGPESEMD